MLELQNRKMSWRYHGRCWPHSGLCYIRTKRQKLLFVAGTLCSNLFKGPSSTPVLALLCVSQPARVVHLEGRSMECSSLVGWRCMVRQEGSQHRGLVHVCMASLEMPQSGVLVSSYMISVVILGPEGGYVQQQTYANLGNWGIFPWSPKFGHTLLGL